MSKIGLGIITCNREDFYKQCYESIPLDAIDKLVTVNDGKKLKGSYSDTKIITHSTNKGVGISKNDAMQYLLDEGCEHIFLIEDDIIIKDRDVFLKYIETGDISGLKHLMYGYHGPANKDQFKNPISKLRVDYSKDCKVVFNTHCVGAFCYYHDSILRDVGLMDTAYTNAWEHVDHSYQIAKKRYIPAYWWWPDVANSYDYLDELACSEDNSAIRPRPDWQTNIQTGAQHFINKHNYSPINVPDTPEQEIVQRLKLIKQKNEQPV